MTNDLAARAGPEFDRLKRASDELIEHIGTLSLSQTDHENLIELVSRIAFANNESLSGTSTEFNFLLRCLDVFKQDVETLSLIESDRQSFLTYIGRIEEALLNLKAIFWERELPTLLAKFEKIWTMEKENWWLGENDMIHHELQSTLIVENDEWYFYIIEQMKEAGNRRITFREYRALFPIDLSDGRISPPPAQASNPPDPREPDNTEH